MEGYTSVPQNPNVPPPMQYGPPQTQPGPYGPPQTQPGPYVPPQNVGGYNSTNIPPQGYQGQPMPPVTVVHPPTFGGIQYVYVQDPMAELAMSTGVLIRQQAQFLEQITGCESPNRYYVFSQSPQAGMKLLFKCKEYSSCCMRQCCPANSREFNMYIKHIATVNDLDENFSAPFITVQKPFKCTCCCLERPEMIATFSGTSQPCGRIKQPYTCCDPEFSLYDSSGTKKYVIHGDCCQCGLCCSNNFCGKLSEVFFHIYRDENLTAPVGAIIKKVATATELITSADSYQVNFPLDASPQEKMLLIVAGLMIDYQFFEQSSSDNRND
jgi:hypothetical protein